MRLISNAQLAELGILLTSASLPLQQRQDDDAEHCLFRHVNDDQQYHRRDALLAEGLLDPLQRLSGEHLAGGERDPVLGDLKGDD